MGFVGPIGAKTLSSKILKPHKGRNFYPIDNEFGAQIGLVKSKVMSELLYLHQTFAVSVSK